MHIGRAGRAGVIALFVIGALASPAVAAQGGPDPNFGSHGSVLSGWPTSAAVAHDVLQIPGGKIVTFGATGDTGEQIDLTRYNANGSVDSTFGVAGHAVDSITGSGITEYPKKVLRQSDGKYVGVAEVTGPSSVPAIGLIRFTTGGVLDTTFGTGGRTVYDVPGAFTATGATLQADGSIVVSGDSSTTGGTSDAHHVALARFTAAGLPDVTWGTGEHEAVAIAPIAAGSMASAVRVSGSNLVVGGFALSNGNIARALARFDGAGHLDPTFGTSGTVVTNGALEQNWTQDLAVQSDGKLVLAGFALDSSQDRGMLQLTRYTADGVLDSAFHAQGDVVINDGADYFITAVTLQTDGKIVVTGSRDGNFFVARFLSDGTRDVSFGCTGMTGTDFGGDNDTAYNAFVQSDGRIVAVGFGDPLVDPDSPSEQYAQGFALARYDGTGAPGACGYVLDGFGGIHGYGVTSPLTPPPVDGGYFGWNIARGLALSPSGTGYMLDGWGALHAVKLRGDGFPSGPAFNAAVTGLGYWRGWDIARDVVLMPDGTGGYVLDGWGGLHRFGLGSDTAPPAASAGYWYGWDIARGLALLPDGTGGYVLDGFGGLHPFAIGNHPPPPAVSAGYWNGWDIARGVSILPDGTGGYVLDGFGGLHPFAIGNHPLPPAASAGYWNGWDIARGTALVP